MKNILRQIYSIVPYKFRLGKNYFDYKKFIHTSSLWSIEKIQSWQQQQIAEILSYAYENCDGYRELYLQNNITPRDFQCLDDLSNYPYVTKELLRDNLAAFTSNEFTKRELHYCTTGGSTGIPFGFYNTKSELLLEKAYIHSVWEHFGWSLRDRNIEIRGSFNEKNKLSYYNPLHNQHYLSLYNLSETNYLSYRKYIIENNITNLQAYPSAAFELANLILSHQDESFFNFKNILLGSENIYPWQLERIKQAFQGSTIVAWYGNAEKSNLASWMPSDSSYHFSPTYSFTETKETDQENLKEIIGTSFWLKAMPLIRYRTMDTGYVDEKKSLKSDCVVFSSIEGRSHEFITSRTGQKISMTAINMHDDIFDNLKQFQFEQKKMGQITLNIIPKKNFSSEQLSLIQERLSKKLTDFKLDVNIVERISKSASGKHSFLKSSAE